MLFLYAICKLDLHVLLILESVASFAIKVASRICLLRIKTFWLFDTTFPTVIFSLLARTFAWSLCIVHKTNWPITLNVFYPSLLGMRIKNVALRPQSMESFEWNSLNNCITSLPTIGWQNFQNPIEKCSNVVLCVPLTLKELIAPFSLRKGSL